jgi:hypothetical protein
VNYSRRAFFASLGLLALAPVMARQNVFINQKRKLWSLGGIQPARASALTTFYVTGRKPWLRVQYVRERGCLVIDLTADDTPRLKHGDSFIVTWGEGGG